MKKTKMAKLQKKLAVTASAAILIILAIGGRTIAYFTDTESKTNTFTYGDVDIQLKENGGDGPVEKEGFLPITNTADPTADVNYVKKDVTVENTGNAGAYIRTFIAVPSKLYTSGAVNLVFEDNLSTAWEATGQYERYIDGTGEADKYIVLVYTYIATNTTDGYKSENGKLLGGNTTTSLLKGVYTSANADIREGKVILWNQPGDMTQGYTETGYELNPDRKFNIYVNTQAVQSDGFDSASTAFSSAYGNKDPWGTVIQ